VAVVLKAVAAVMSCVAVVAVRICAGIVMVRIMGLDWTLFCAFFSKAARFNGDDNVIGLPLKVADAAEVGNVTVLESGLGNETCTLLVDDEADTMMTYEKVSPG